jgi:hypothetical protein
LGKSTLSQRSSDDAGLALAFGDGQLFLACTDDNQNLRLWTCSDDLQACTVTNLFSAEKSSDNAGPALGFGAGHTLCIGWVGQA